MFSGDPPVTKSGPGRQIKGTILKIGRVSQLPMLGGLLRRGTGEGRVGELIPRAGTSVLAYNSCELWSQFRLGGTYTGLYRIFGATH